MNQSSKQQSKRQLSVASTLQKAISTIFVSNQIYCEALDGILLTFPSAKVSADLRIATIYIRCFEESKIKEVLNILKTLAPDVRKLLASKIQLRYMPEIRFAEDKESVKHDRILKMLDELSVN